MAEKGILVNDAASGESVACRDAVELDDDSNSRIIQRVDVVKGPLPSNFYAAGTLIRTIDAADGYFPSSWPAEVMTNVLTVGDKSTLVVLPVSDLGISASHLIMPVLVRDDSGSDIVCGHLQVEDIDGSGKNTPLQIPSGESNIYMHQIETWDVCGAEKIALVMPVTAASPSLYLYAALI